MTVVIFLLAFPNFLFAASTLRVDRGTVRVGEEFRIEIALEGEDATIGRLPIPLTNVEIVAGPEVFSEFTWVNGRMTRRKVLRYTARPLGEGRAVVGPIRMWVDGKRFELEGAALRVLPAIDPESRTPGAILRQMERDGREAVFLAAEASTTRAVVGQQIVVTWVLYARDAVTTPTITALPDFEGFWVEEIPLPDGRPGEEMIGGEVVTRAEIRKAALFPLRAGTLEVGELAIRSGVIRLRDPFGFGGAFRSGVVNVVRTSQPLRIEVDPVPAQAQVVGEFSMRCTDPVSRGGGPAAFEVRVEGSGNLRTAPSPSFVTPPDGEWQVNPRDVEVYPASNGVAMRRHWTYILLGNAVRGRSVPPLELRAWSPEERRIETLRCEPGEIAVMEAAQTPAPAPSRVEAVIEEEDAPSPPWPAAAAIALLLAGGGVWLAFVRHRDRLRPDERRILDRADEPRAMKEEVRALLRERNHDEAALYRGESPLADAFRALWSLLDVLEKEPWEKERSQDDLRRRVREFVRRV
ncbi:MAG: BatD family protein [Thermoanaerobaculia bacterium]